MNADLAKRVRAAAGAAWMTVVIGWLFMAAAWVGVVFLLRQKPEWAITVWGGGEVQWSDLHRIYIIFFGVLKAILWVMLMVAIWLSGWHRRLRRASEVEG
jgi:hypothetical protein